MIDYSPYILHSAHPQKNRSSQRQGALLKVTFEDDTIGYADCHPWPELGDLSLTEQLETLRQDKTTPLTERSLHFARLDASARKQGRSLFEELEIPSSHLLLPENLLRKNILSEAIQNGFSTFKVKLGKDWNQALTLLNTLAQDFTPAHFRLRLDFNLQLTEQEFLQFLKDAEALLSNIDFIEDPFPFEKNSWSHIQKQYSVRLACDHHSFKAIDAPQAAAVLVVKPAVQDEAIFLRSLKNHQELVFTSYLDHPVGQLFAAYVAALCRMKAPARITTCGLFSHTAYLPDDFSKAMRSEGSRLLPPEGTGIGFNHLLESLPWNPL